MQFISTHFCLAVTQIQSRMYFFNAGLISKQNCAMLKDFDTKMYEENGGSINRTKMWRGTVTSNHIYSVLHHCAQLWNGPFRHLCVRLSHTAELQVCEISCRPWFNDKWMGVLTNILHIIKPSISLGDILLIFS